jgi:hypothetical protein
MKYFALFACLLLCGCSVLPKIKMPGVGTVQAFKDAGTPATIAEGTERTGFRVPAKSKMTVTRRDALPSEGVLLPAETSWTFELPEATDFMSEVRQIQASTGTVDTSVAKRRADNEERRIILFAAIAAGIATIASVKFWPSISMLLGALTLGLVILWQAASWPAWAWALVGLPLAAAGIWWGYSRKEAQVKTEKLETLEAEAATPTP